MPAARLLGAFALLTVPAAVACATTGGHTPRPFPRPGGAPPAVAKTEALPPTSTATAIVATALSFQGTPYRFGGADPSGFDCSGFVHYVFGQHGLEVPRVAPELFQAGDRVMPAEVLPGDLVFFSTSAPGPSHVGIALGGGDFVHAPSAQGDVRVESLHSPYWRARFIGARRLVGTR